MLDTIESKINKKQAIYLDWTIDLLLYIVILNLFAQYSPNIYFDSFLMSIFTAFVLKVILVLIGSLEHRITNFFNSKGTKLMKAIGIALAFFILFTSKFLILEIIDIIFKDKVEIYGFVTLIFMILAMILSRIALQKVYINIGDKN